MPQHLTAEQDARTSYTSCQRMLPEQLEVLNVIPRNATGKIDKKGLRETYKDSERPTR